MLQKAHSQRFTHGMLQMGNREKVVVAMVGLPARGKSYFSKKVTRFLHWLGFSCQIFNIGNYRRNKIGTTSCTQNFFDPNNPDGSKKRQDMAQEAIDDLVSFLKEGGDVAIYDGTNTTKQRRQFIQQELNQKLPGTFLMFAEIICDDPDIIGKNIRLTKLKNPDYKGIDPEVAQSDFMQRIQNYEKVYEYIDDDEGFSYIKLFNMGKKFIVNNINGYLPCKILSFIFHYHVQTRPIYLARAGKVAKQRDVLGGDCELGDQGKLFSQNLNAFFQKTFQSQEERQNVTILTSTRTSAVETANYIKLGVKVIQMKCLDELNFGIIDGFDIQELKIKHPEIYKEHMKNNISYRYPMGESFLDLISRLEPVIFEIERAKHPVIVISHHYMLKALYCYFVQKNVEDVMTTLIPKHHLIKLIPDVTECEHYVYDLDPLSVKEQDLKMKKSISMENMAKLVSQTDHKNDSSKNNQNIQQQKQKSTVESLDQLGTKSSSWALKTKSSTNIAGMNKTFQEQQQQLSDQKNKGGKLYNQSQRRIAENDEEDEEESNQQEEEEDYANESNNLHLLNQKFNQPQFKIQKIMSDGSQVYGRQQSSQRKSSYNENYNYSSQKDLGQQINENQQQKQINQQQEINKIFKKTNSLGYQDL